MPESRSATPIAAPVEGQHLRLARALADMVPEAAVLRVALYDPSTAWWPHPHARAYDAVGKTIALNRSQAVSAARWIMRTYPEAARGDVYEFQLATARLHRVAAATRRG